MHRPGGHRQVMRMSEVGRNRGGGATAVNGGARAPCKQTRAPLRSWPLLPHGNAGSEWLELPTFLEIPEN